VTLEQPQQNAQNTFSSTWLRQETL